MNDAVSLAPRTAVQASLDNGRPPGPGRAGAPSRVGKMREGRGTVEEADPHDAPQDHPTRPPTRALEPFPILDTAPAGRALGSRYRVLERVGSGATGTVWRGVRTDDDLPVAVKLLRSDLAEDPEVVTRFVRERSTLVRLDHPRLVRVLDLVSEGDVLAIVMELIDGPDLRRLSRSSPLPPAEAMLVLADVGSALDSVHRAGIVHRDVKPENVLVEQVAGRSRGRLTDFGVARTTGGSRLTRRSHFVGTPGYLAPEVALGRGAIAASDVYALGVIGYEVLAGRAPFLADHDLAVLRQHIDEPVERPGGLPDAVWDVVAGCLEKDPADRPTAQEAADSFCAVAPLLVGRPPVQLIAAPVCRPVSGARGAAGPAVVAGPEDGDPTTTGSRLLPTAPPPPPAPSHRRRAVLALVGSIVLAAAAGAGIRWATAPEPPPRLTLVPLDVEAQSPSPGVVRLTFDPAQVPGARLLTVERDGQPVARDVAPEATSYDLAEPDPEDRHCYRVQAITSTPPTEPASAAPNCLVADGGAGPAAPDEAGQP